MAESSIDEQNRRDRDLFFAILDGKTEATLSPNVGTDQWSDETYNFIDSNYECPNACLYCYARKMKLRFHREATEPIGIPDPSRSDGEMKINFKVDQRKVDKGWRKTGKSKTIMMPSTHDIFLEGGGVDAYITIARKMMDAGHRVLCVLKARFECLKKICDTFRGNEVYQNALMFRITIGTDNNQMIQKWEINAPFFEERVAALKYAFDSGFRTSVSMEPFITRPTREMLTKFDRYVSDSIWIGTMNYLTSIRHMWDFPEIEDLVAEQEHLQTQMLEIITELRDHPKVFWKTGAIKLALKIN